MSTNRAIEHEARNLLIHYGQKCAQRKIKHKCILVSGDPGTEICNIVKKHHIDVLFVGNRKLGALEKFFLGSVSEYCLKHADCSVMIHKKGTQVQISQPSPSISSSSTSETMSHHHVTPQELLENTSTFECLGKHKPFVHLEATDTVGRVVKVLTDWSISALPIRDASRDLWLGFVDMMDVAQYINNILKDVKTDAELGDIIAKKPLESARANQLFERVSPGKALRFLPTDFTLKDALELIVEKGFERFGIQDATGKYIGILSETKIVSYLSERSELFGFSHKTVADLQLGYREVISVNQNTILKSAVETLLVLNVHGVGVVDDSGKLIGNFSVSDLKMATSEEELIKMFFLPIKDILAQQKQALIPSPICVQQSATIEEVLEKFTITRVHRIYVVSEKEENLGVITMSDLMSLFFTVFISK